MRPWPWSCDHTACDECALSIEYDHAVRRGIPFVDTALPKGLCSEYYSYQVRTKGVRMTTKGKRLVRRDVVGVYELLKLVRGIGHAVAIHASRDANAVDKFHFLSIMRSGIPCQPEKVLELSAKSDMPSKDHFRMVILQLPTRCGSSLVEHVVVAVIAELALLVDSKYCGCSVHITRPSVGPWDKDMHGDTGAMLVRVVAMTASKALADQIQDIMHQAVAGSYNMFVKRGGDVTRDLPTVSVAEEAELPEHEEVSPIDVELLKLVAGFVDKPVETKYKDNRKAMIANVGLAEPIAPGKKIIVAAEESRFYKGLDIKLERELLE